MPPTRRTHAERRGADPTKPRHHVRLRQGYSLERSRSGQVVSRSSSTRTAMRRVSHFSTSCLSQPTEPLPIRMSSGKVPVFSMRGRWSCASRQRWALGLSISKFACSSTFSASLIMETEIAGGGDQPVGGSLSKKRLRVPRTPFCLF